MSEIAKMLKSVFVLWVVVAPMVLTSSAHADDVARPTKPEAKTHWIAGNRLYHIREFKQAIEEYKAGALKEDTPVFNFNLGQCYRQLGLYDEAIWHFERFLSRANPSEERRLMTEKILKEMKDKLRERPATPAPAPVEPAHESRMSSNTAAAAIERDAPWYSDPLGWGVTGAAVVGLGTSVGLLLNAKTLDERANREMQQSLSVAFHDRASDRRLIGVAVAVGSGAFLAIGIVKLARHQSRHQHGVTAYLYPDLTGGGLALKARF